MCVCVSANPRDLNPKPKKLNPKPEGAQGAVYRVPQHPTTVTFPVLELANIYLKKVGGRGGAEGGREEKWEGEYKRGGYGGREEENV